MTDKFFVDTNVLVYRRDQDAGAKQQQAASWLRALWQKRAGRISSQVLNEFYTVVTRKLTPGMPADAARAEIREFFTWQPLPISVETIEGAWRIETKYAISYWDSLILSAAKIANCAYLLTEDLQDEQIIDQIRIVNPFHTTPSSYGL